MVPAAYSGHSQKIFSETYIYLEKTHSTNSNSYTTAPYKTSGRRLTQTIMKSKTQQTITHQDDGTRRTYLAHRLYAQHLALHMFSERARQKKAYKSTKQESILHNIRKKQHEASRKQAQLMIIPLRDWSKRLKTQNQTKNITASCCETACQKHRPALNHTR